MRVRLATFVCILFFGATGCVKKPVLVPIDRGFPVGGRILTPGEGDVVVALGATADIALFAPSDRLLGEHPWLVARDAPSVAVRRVVSSKPGIVRVVRSDAHGRIRVRGSSRGTSTLALMTSRGQSQILVHVAEPDQATLQHDSLDLAHDAPRVFLRGGTARFAMVRRDAGGRELRGWGSPVPVRVDPPGAARMTIPEETLGRLDVTVTGSGRVVLRPMGGDPVTLDVVEPSGDLTFGVDAFTTPPATGPLASLSVGKGQLVVLWVRAPDGRRVFGLVGHTHLISATPAVCTTRDASAWYTEGVYAITPVAHGECHLTAHFDAQSMDISVPVD